MLGYKKPEFAFVGTTNLYRVEENEEKGHEYSHCTRKLLEFASLVRKIDETRKCGRLDLVKEVEGVLKEVKMNRKMLQDEIMSGLYAELRVLKAEKEELRDCSGEIVLKVYESKREEEKGVRNGDKVRMLREERKGMENEYVEMWDRIEEIEDLIARREMMVLSIGVRELISIERECEKLCEGFVREMKRGVTSSTDAPVTRLSKDEI